MFNIMLNIYDLKFLVILNEIKTVPTLCDNI